MRINIRKEYKIPLSFRTSKVAAMFDVPFEEKLSKEWNIHLPIEDKEWQIGLVVGHSGSGKTTIAKKIYGDEHLLEEYEWDPTKSILDNFDDDLEAKEITSALSSVGFSSPPHWMLPYPSLSNGQKFRVNLARAILSKSDKVVFDEFTSLVDRDIAKISCAAVSKALKKSKKKFIAVTCHDDVIEWLSPDWVYNVSTNVFEWRSLQRPAINIHVYETSKQAWEMFKEHHYLGANLNPSAKCYVAYWQNHPVAFSAVMHFPHPKVKNMKREHRTVVLPDFQGVGIGNKFSDAIADIYKQKGYRFRSVTSHPAMIFYRARSKKWKMTEKMRLRTPFSKTAMLKPKGQNGQDRLIASFEYVGL